MAIQTWNCRMRWIRKQGIEEAVKWNGGLLFVLSANQRIILMMGTGFYAINAVIVGGGNNVPGNRDRAAK